MKILILILFLCKFNQCHQNNIVCFTQHFTMKNRTNSKFIFTFILFFQLHIVTAQKEVTFSVQAHEDDWQLFMSSNIIDDVADKNNKVVFITLTAGDDGYGKQGYDAGLIPYYLAREKGALYSCKFVADFNERNPELLPIAQRAAITYRHPKGDSVTHFITKYIYKNTVNYFLRLPDGNRNGKGFDGTDFQSLQRLKEHKIQNIKAIDCSSDKYVSWFDLTQTILQIILNEREDAQQVWVNCASTDELYNRNDHSDHLHTAMAVQDATAGLDWIGIASWMDYSSRKKRDNLNNRQYENATAAFAIYNWSLIENRYWTDFSRSHRHWLAMDYFRASPPKGTYSDIGVKDKLRGVPTNTPMVVSYTNPVKSGHKIDFFMTCIENGTLKIELFDLNGVQLDSKEFQVREGDNNLSFKINSLQSGDYLIRLVLNNKYAQTKKLIVIE